MAATVSGAAQRGWAIAEQQSLEEQKHLFSSVVSLYALNPFVLPVILLAWLLALSKLLTSYPTVRTLLYLLAVCWSHAVILAIRMVTPTCFLYFAYVCVHSFLPTSFTSGLPVLTGIIGWFALAFSIVEIVFYFHTIKRARRLQARVPGPDFPNARRWLVFRRVEEASHCVQPMHMPKNCRFYRKFRNVRDTHQSSNEAASPNYASVGGSPSPLVASRDHPFGRAADGQHPLEFLKGWFYNIPLRKIKHENLMTFFAESQKKKNTKTR